MKPSFKEKLMVFIAVAFGTATFVYISTHLMVGLMGVCR